MPGVLLLCTTWPGVFAVLFMRGVRDGGAAAARCIEGVGRVMGVGRERAGAWCVGWEEPRRRGESAGVDIAITLLEQRWQSEAAGIAQTLRDVGIA